MSPANGVRADWQPPVGQSLAAHPSLGSGSAGRPRLADAQRLEAALDRISAALVRRAEQDAHLAEAAAGVAPPLNDAIMGELRHRLDDMIGRIRTLLGDAAP